MLKLLNPIATPIADVLAAFYAVIPNFGVAILLLSVVWMVLISPLTLKSTRSMLAMQALQPELKRLQEKHRNDKQAFAQAQMDLFRERGVSPWGSCLPTLLPLPVFFALFQVIDGLSRVVNGVAMPRYLNQNSAMYHAIQRSGGHISAFGVDLAKNAFSPHSSVFAALPFYGLVLLMIATQYYQTAMTMNRNPAAAQNPQMKMMKYIPIVFGLICIRFPAGVILYYAMSNLCRIAQQVLMYRYDPKVKALVVRGIDEVEAKTREIDQSNAAKKKGPAKADPPAGRPRLRELLANASAASEKDRPGSAPPGRNGAGSGSTKGPGGGKSAPSRGSPPQKAKPANTKANTNTKPNTGAKPAASAKPANARATTNGKANANSRTNANGNAANNGNNANGSAKAPATSKLPSNTKAANANGNGTTIRPDNVGAGAARTGAGAGRNIPPRSGRSKKRRGR